MSEQTPQAPLVGLVMGSDSDWPTMKAAAEALDEFGIPFEADVVSAHRMAAEMIDYGRSAHERGLRVIIAGAGGAAHLPGMLASVTPLPVIGVPVALKHLDGMDSLLSIVQMPSGVPVAAGETDFAAELREKLLTFQEELADQAHAKGSRLREEAAELPTFCSATAPRSGSGER